MRAHKTLAGLCAAALLSAAQAEAQEVALGEEGAKAKSEHPRGSYGGVKPGGDEPPAISAKPGSTPPAITWPGFQAMPDGSSRVFVQVTTQVDVSAASVNGKIVVDLGNVAIVGKTNRFPLITKFFNTPVTQVEVKRANKRTTLVLSMRAQVEPRISHEQAKSGFHFVYIDFPTGSYLPHEPQAAAATPSTAPAVDLPEAAKPEDVTAREAPSHLEGAASGQVKASGSASLSASGSASAGTDTSVDAELPPGVSKTNARSKTKASGKLKFGK
jgi:hypothetical protein